MEKLKENIIQTKSFNFALEIIKLYQELNNRKKYILSKQLLRSGTSIGANIEEANSGQSKKDFLAKIYISLKETKETRYWLKLLNESNLVDLNIDAYLLEIDSIINILTKITKTTSNNIKN